MTFTNVMNEQKFWDGPPPRRCDLCGEPIVAAFVDGKTRMGPWATMCLDCHDLNGVGFGPGLGQIYTLVKEKESANAK